LAASPTVVSNRAHARELAPAAEGARLLYEDYYDRIYGYCLYHLGSREEAEDAAQTTFLWAFRGLRRGVVPRAEDSWLFTIAKNACRARHRTRGRKRQREVISDPQLLADLTAAPAKEHEELIGLQDALARMPELQRRAILLREWRGLSYREIAAELDISGAAVETLIFRARRSLAELLAGRPAPKRARRFAFEFGSLGAALKSLFGAGSAAKLAVGVAAVVMATTFAGSAQRVDGRDRTRTSLTPPSLLQEHPRATNGSAATKSVNEKAKRATGAKAAEPAKSAPSSTDPPPGEASSGGPGSALGQTLDETTASLPLPSELAGATDAADDVVETATKAVDDTVDTIKNVVPPAADVLP
jgi:RNA polymerase sigma factor (sigma-70 family)